MNTEPITDAQTQISENTDTDPITAEHKPDAQIQIDGNEISDSEWISLADSEDTPDDLDEPWMPPNYNLILKSMKKLQQDSPYPLLIPITLLHSSSVDYNQVAGNTLGLITHQQSSKFGNFWSSDGSQTPFQDEHLLFSSRHDYNEIFLLDRIDILFHVEACHEYPHNVYHSEKIKISVGYIEGVWESVKEVTVKDKEAYLRKGYFPIELDEHVFCRYVLVEF
jgi:hypothetical protein